MEQFLTAKAVADAVQLARESGAQVVNDWSDLIRKQAVEAIVDQKEAALCGYIAWVAMCDPNSPLLKPEAMSMAFGDWLRRLPVVERRGVSYYVVG